MEISIFIARIFGLCYLVCGVGLLFNRKVFQQVMDDFARNALGLFYGGLFALVIGVVMILTHNIWVSNWTVIVTIIGWIAFIKGVWIIVFPQTVFKFMQVYQENENMLLVHSIVALILGVVMTFFGFFAG